MEVVIHNTGIKVVHIPYNAAGPFSLALIGNEVQMGFQTEQSVLSFGGKFRPLAVTGETRSAAYPDVPTFKELGHAQIRPIAFSVNVPKGVPKDAFDKLYTAGSRALKNTEVKAALQKLGLEVNEQTPEAAAKALADETQLYADIAKKVGIQPQ